jgi:serine/threonine protein kinase
VDRDDERPTDAIDVPIVEEDTNVTDEQLGPGFDVGGYIIDGELGHGGMGVVYSATHPVIGKRAAIKVLRPELSKDPSAVERFVNEARAVNQIGHPNIVDIFAIGTLIDGRSYYVMDLLVGETLRMRLKRGAMHISEAATAIDEMASALIAAHVKGIIHRDLKPDNVFMVSVPGRWPEVKLLDFGLAKLVQRPAGSKIRTITGSMLGTPAYMSPEQARSSDLVDHRTDVYSLGVLAYELLTGAAPFQKQSSIDTLLAHQEDPVPPLLDAVPTLPVELAQLIEAMLAKEPDDRPTLAAVAAVLKRLKGTKIPTMTAAGIRMDVSYGTPPTFDESNDSLSPPTVNEFAITRPRMKSAQPMEPMQPAPIGTPAPEFLARGPILPGTATTLAGHSMPMPSASMPFVRPSYPPPGAMPPPGPMGFPSAAGLLPPEPKSVIREPRSRRWIVIAIVALVASSIGIAIAMLT